MFYRVSGQSMEPEYIDGTVVLVSKNTVKLGLNVGDVVVAPDPRSGRLILKRISKISETAVFLRGDKSSESTDSRTFGLIQKENIIGKVVMKLPKGFKGWLGGAVPVLASLGFVDAAYLTFKHFEGGKVECGIVPGADCNIVLGSMYSEIYGMPLALLGSLYYLTVLTLWTIYWRREENVILRMLLGATSIGFIASLYLIYIQGFVLNAYCLFCMASAFISITLFVLMIVMTSSKEGVIFNKLNKDE